MTPDDALRFATEWVAAWNGHDPDRILAHYADDVVYRSPFVTRLTGKADGVLVGKAAVADYVRAGLNRFPELAFTLRHVFAGAGSVVIEYDSVTGLVAAETFVLDAAGRATHVFCHYRPADSTP